MKQMLRVASYRFRATLNRQWGSYVSLILLIALLGGLSMASLAGARRTDSSFPIYVASTNPETTQVFAGFDDPQLGSTSGYDPHVLRAIAHLPLVEQSAVSVGFDGNINLNGVKGLHPHSLPGETPPTLIGGTEYLTIDRATLISGHWFKSNRPDEAVINAQAERELGVHVGSVIQVPFYSDEESTSSTYNGPPYRFPKITIVGVVVINSTVIQDEINALGSSVVLMSPALTKQLETCCSYYSGIAVVLRGGSASESRFQAEVAKVDPISKLGIGGGGSVSQALAKGQREIKPEAIALGVFGLIAGVAALLICGLTIGRMLRAGATEMRTVQALGASTSDGALDRVDRCVARGRHGCAPRRCARRVTLATRSAWPRTLRLSVSRSLLRLDGARCWRCGDRRHADAPRSRTLTSRAATDTSRSTSRRPRGAVLGHSSVRRRQACHSHSRRDFDSR